VYKTIVAHIDTNAGAQASLHVAARLAAEHDAHFVGSAETGISSQGFAMLAMSPGVMPGHGDFNVLRKNAAARLQEFEDCATRFGVQSWERRVVEEDAEHALQLESLYADLIVLSFPQPGRSRRLSVDMIDSLALHAGCPLLVVPTEYAPDTVGRTIVFGWDASSAASRAMHAALPLLRRAAFVVVALINPDPDLHRHGARPGVDVATYLARHGVTVEVLCEHGVHGAAEALLRVARDVGADLVVAGAYGHSRNREVLFGGATRDLLECTGLPLLLAH
jgi:nucleotide-binding universal stress UspA family protein